MFLEGLGIGDISLQYNFRISFKIKNAQAFDPASSPSGVDPEVKRRSAPR